MIWYKTEERKPKRGDRLIFKGYRNPEKEIHKYTVLANYIFDSEWLPDEESLDNCWADLRERYKYWGYMDDFIKDEDEDK